MSSIQRNIERHSDIDPLGGFLWSDSTKESPSIGCICIDVETRRDTQVVHTQIQMGGSTIAKLHIAVSNVGGVIKRTCDGHPILSSNLGSTNEVEVL